MPIGVLEKLQEFLLANRPVALATIIDRSGSIPNEVGAKMLVGAGGELLSGTVGGGEIEYQTLREASEAIALGKHRKVKSHLTEKDAHGIGMMCGGSAEVFIEVYMPKPQLVLVGGGHVNLELARLARPFGFACTVIDDRPEWASVENYPEATLLHANPAPAFEQIAWNEGAFVVIATRDRDMEALRASLDVPCRYVGLVASKRKTVQILKLLANEGHDLSQLKERLRSPSGLDLGGKSPADVALSILAEIQMVRNQRTGKPLSFVLDPRLES